MRASVGERPIVGRESELAALDAELVRAGGGEFRCLLLVGEPGVGKTRLATALVDGHARDVVALRARGYPLGTTTPFGLWAEALDGHARRLGVEEARRLWAPWLEPLASVLPALHAGGGATRSPPDRLHILTGLAGCLEVMAAEQPVLVLLDDVHVADPSSWDALEFMARALAARPVLVVAAARPVDLSARAKPAEVLSLLDGAGSLTRLRVDALDGTALTALAETMLGFVPPAALTAWLEERSRGYPLFAIGLLQALLDERADLASPALERVPEGLAERVRAQLAGLEEPALATLEVLALLGRVDLGALVRFTRRPLERLAPILDGLVRARLVAQFEQGRALSYEIAHPLVQETIYESIGSARRRALHRQVARALLGSGDLGAAAPHFANSAEPGDAEAIAALSDAIREAETQGSYREAFEILRALLELLAPGDERWLVVLDAMAREPEWIVDHRADLDAATGVEVLRQIERLIEATGDPMRRGSVQFRLAHFLGWGLAEPDQAERACRRALQLFEQAGAQRAALMAVHELAFQRGMAMDLTAWALLARRALDGAKASGDQLVEMWAEGCLGIALDWVGRFDDAEAGYRRSVELARALGRSFRLNWSYVHLAISLALQGRHAESAEAIAAAEASHADHRETLLSYRPWTSWLAGDMVAAAAASRQLMDWHPEGLSVRQVPPAPYAALAAAERGLADEAASISASIERTCRGRPVFGLLYANDWARGNAAWLAGRIDEALASLRLAADALAERGILMIAPFALADVAEVAAVAGVADIAEGAAERLAAMAASSPTGPASGFAGVAGAWAALIRGDREEAATAAAGAARRLKTRWPLYHARALGLQGRALVPIDRARAVTSLSEAASAFEACGATIRRQDVLEELSRLGTRGQRAADRIEGIDALTARERDVVGLAVEGLTAREVGARLYIGERTVETHLARAYAKLGVTGRRELRARAGELGLR